MNFAFASLYSIVTSLSEPPKIPFILPWQQRGSRLDMEIHINLFYPNALNPKKWVRESSGPMVPVSEAFAYHVDAKHMQNSSMTTLPFNGTWNRVTPWLPWMLMGQTPGHMLYSAFMGSGEDLEQVHSRQLLDYVEKNYNKYFFKSTIQDSILSVLYFSTSTCMQFRIKSHTI